MLLSLSVRIAEEFLSKEQSRLTLEELIALARNTGYDGLCMRGSQVGVHSRPEQRQEVAAAVGASGLRVTMVTGDFDMVYNNERGPDCLRRIEPYLDLAELLQARIVRVALKQPEDIGWAQRAADAAAARGLVLAHQCHTLSLFETVDDIERTLRAIGRPNFGLIYEPANLELCGEDYGLRTLERLAPWIVNVYLQNQRLRVGGDVTLDTWCRGPVAFDLLPIHAPGGIDFDRVFAGLRAIGYDGPVTAHQSGIPGIPLEDTTSGTARFLKGLMHAG